TFDVVPLFFSSPSPTRYLHSFPTRRSSDLACRRGRRARARADSRVSRSICPSEVAHRHVVSARTLDALPRCAAQALPPRTLAERSEEHTSELQSRVDLVCRLLLEKKKKNRH